MKGHWFQSLNKHFENMSSMVKIKQKLNKKVLQTILCKSVIVNWTRQDKDEIGT